MSLFFRVQISENVSKCASRQSQRLYAPGLGLLGSPRLASASLALPAPATTAAALRAARPPKAAGLLLRGAGKASEADSRRGKPSKARPGAFHGFFYLAYLGPGPFIWPMAWGLHGFFYLSGPCTSNVGQCRVACCESLFWHAQWPGRHWQCCS